MASRKINKLFAKGISHSSHTRALSDVKYIVIHYTGNRGDTARANCNYFRTGNQSYAGAHFFVDRSGAIWESVKLKYPAWAVGGGWMGSGKPGEGSLYGKCTNYNSVSIELCDIATKDPSKAQIAAVRWLIRHIRKYCPNAKAVVRHWDVNGKSCPGRMTGKSTTAGGARWQKFRKAVL